MGEVRTSQGEQTKEIYRWFYTESLFGEKYQERQNNSKGYTEFSCVFCGRDTSKQGKSNGVMVGAGGSVIVHPEDYEKAIEFCDKILVLIPGDAEMTNIRNTLSARQLNKTNPPAKQPTGNKGNN